MQHKLTKKISLGYNLGVEWDGESPEPTYIYTLTQVTSLTKKINCFAEVYGFAPSLSKAKHSFDGGLTYLLNKNLMIDLSGGLGLTNNAPHNYLSVRLSYRFNTAVNNFNKASHAAMHFQKFS